MDPYGPYWEALELEPGSDLDAVKRAYREQALTWHPDRFPYDPELRARCEEKMRHVNAAYEALRELVEGGLPPLPGESQAWRPAPDPAEPAPEEDEGDGPGWVERWLGAPRPRGRVEEAAAAVPDAPPPEWASLAYVAAALTAAAAVMLAIFALRYQAGPGYGMALRLIASPALAYAAAAAATRRVWETALSLLLLSFALNPVLPVPMSLEDWRIFNAVTPLLLVGMFLRIARGG